MANNTNRQVSIFINGKEVENTIKAITAEKKKLQNEVAKLVIGTQEYNDKIAELAKLDSIVRDHSNAIKGIEGAWYKNIPAVQNFIAVGAGLFAVDKIIAYGQELGQLAVKTDTLARKSQTVLGDQLGRVTEEAEKNAHAMGLTTAAYVAQTAGIADLLIPMGFQRDKAGEMSVQLENLSGAMSEWSGGQHTAADASGTLSKALLGEREELKSYGIAISEEEVKQRLLTKGMQDLTGQRLAQAKAIATMELIMEKSIDAQTAFATGTDSLIRQQALFKARIEEISEKLAKIFMPILATLGTVINALITPLEAVVDKLNEFARPVETTAAAFKAQKDAVNGLQKDITPLLNRYDELNTKSNRSTKEQTELNNIAKKVGETIPIAANAFGKYGEALSLNTDIARNFINTEKVRLQYLNEAAILEQSQHLFRMEMLAEELQAQLEAKATQRIINTDDLSTTEQNLTNEQLQETQKTLNTIQKRIEGAKAQMAFLKGETLSQPKTETTTTAPKDPESDKEKQAKEALSRLKDIIKQNNAEINKINQEGIEKDIAQTVEKYRRQIEDVEKFKKDYPQKISEANKIEVQLNQQQNQAIRALLADRFKDIESEVADAQVEANLKLQSEEEKEIAALHKKYKKRLDELRALQKDETNTTVEERQKAHALELQLLNVQEEEITNLRTRKQFERQAKEAEANIAFEEAMKKLREDYEAALNQKPVKVGNDGSLNETIVSIQEQSTLEIATITQKYDALIEAEKGYDDRVTALRKKKADLITAIERKEGSDITKAKQEFAKKQIETEAALEQAKYNALNASAEIAKQFFDQNSTAYKAFVIFQKTLAVAEIIINLQKEIALLSVARAAAMVTQNLPLAGIITAQMAIARLNAFTGVASVVATTIPTFTKQKYEGGFTDVYGDQDNQRYRAKVNTDFTGGFAPTPTLLVGERGPEYVIPDYLLRNPVVANFTRIIESIRVNRTVTTPQRADGGSTLPNNTPQITGSSATVALVDNRTVDLLQGIYDALLSGRIIAIVDTEGALKINDAISYGKKIRGY